MTDSTPTLERVADAIQRWHHDNGKLRPSRQDALGQARAALDASGNDELVEALKDAREAIASLEDDALGTAFPANVTSNDQGWPIRDELLAKIDAAIARTQEQSDG